jgi:hypothetical protein
MALTALRLRHKDLGLGLLATALAHLHVGGLARRFFWL